MGKYTGFNVFLRHALKYGFSLFGVPTTGQTTKYANGDDGDLQKGYPKQGPRFTDNGDGTITDNGTGLMWVKDGSGAGGHNGYSSFWPYLLGWCNDLAFAGYRDWRMPNIKELITIVDYSRFNPAIYPIFINNQQWDYWTSTTRKYATTYAKCVGFSEGTPTNKAKATSAAFIRPVRLGVPI